MLKCKSFKRYKGIYPPRCNNGKPCWACVKKYWKNLGIIIKDI